MSEALAEQTPTPKLETADQQADNQQNKKTDQQRFDENKLSKTEVQALREGKVTIAQLAEEREQLKAAAEAELKRLALTTRDNESLIDVKEYKAFMQELEDTDSPDITQDILDRIVQVPAEKEKEKAKDTEDSKELDPEDPKLLKLQKRFNKICDNHKYLIGERQVPGFKAWFEQERANKPTVKHLEGLIARLEGKEIVDRDGLAPRREEYSKLKRLFQRYGIASPVDCPWIRQEGLSERQEFRKNAEEMEEHLRKLRDTGFYSDKMIRQTMKEMLMAESPAIQENFLTMAKNIARQEAEGFTHLDSHMTIAGITMRKMSEASKRKYLAYYKDISLQERAATVTNWQTLVENEAKLAKELEEIYADDPEALKLALQSFEELDYIEKEQALKEHERLVEKKDKKEELEKALIVKAAHAKIDAAAQKGTIAAGGDDSTQGKYREFFENEENFRNAKNKEPGDLDALKKAYDILVSAAPQERYKNLAAYEARRVKYQKNLKRLETIDPEITDEEFADWENRYDSESWTMRAKIANEELPTEIAKRQSERAKKRALEAKIGVTNEDHEGVNKPELTATIKAVTELLANDQGAEAMKTLLEYNETDPDNPKILFWMKAVADYMEKFGSGKKKEKTIEKEIETELESLAQNDQGTRDALGEAQIKTLNIQGARISEQRHDQKISGRERAEKDSLDRTDEASLEADLTEHAYSEMGDEYILNEEGTGEKIEEVYFDDTGLLDQDLRSLKQKTYHDQSKLDSKEGFTHIDLTDKSGRQVSAHEAEQLHQKELDKLEEDMATEAEERVAAKTAGNLEADNIFDLNARIAARRKAQELIDEKREEKLHQAA